MPFSIVVDMRLWILRKVFRFGLNTRFQKDVDTGSGYMKWTDVEHTKVGTNYCPISLQNL